MFANVQPPDQSASRDEALDGLRGIAVLLIFLFHYGGGLRAHNPLVRALGYLTQAGWIGVNVFFALSGFLITGLLVRDLGTPHLYRSFYARRALRILPLYLSALFACGVIALLNGASVPELKPLLVYLAFLQNVPSLVQTALHAPPPLPLHHLWSLAVEEQFYLFWPWLLVWALRRKLGLPLCLGLFVSSCCFRAAIFSPHLLSAATAHSLDTALPTRGGALALGSALALYRLKYRERSLKTAAVAVATVAAAFYLSLGFLSSSLLLHTRAAFVLALPAVDVLSAALLALVLYSKFVRQLATWGPLSFLGRISYGFYVLHILLEPLFDKVGALLTHASTGFAYQAARLLAALCISILAAWLSFHCLERPFLRMKRHFPHLRGESAEDGTAPLRPGIDL